VAGLIERMFRRCFVSLYYDLIPVFCQIDSVACLDISIIHLRGFSRPPILGWQINQRDGKSNFLANLRYLRTTYNILVKNTEILVLMIDRKRFVFA